MAFAFIEIEVTDEYGEDLIQEYNKLRKLFKESGGVEHGHTIVCQMFAHKDSDRKYFLSGRVLNPEESKAFAEILAKAKSR